MVKNNIEKMLEDIERIAPLPNNARGIIKRDVARSGSQPPALSIDYVAGAQLSDGSTNIEHETNYRPVSYRLDDIQNPEYWAKRYKLSERESQVFEILWKHDVTESDVTSSEIADKFYRSDPNKASSILSSQEINAQNGKISAIMKGLKSKLYAINEGFVIKQSLHSTPVIGWGYSLSRPIETYTPDERR